MPTGRRLPRLRWLVLVPIVLAALYLAAARLRPTWPLPGAARPRPQLDTFREAAREANLVICLIDAARADHVGCYGYPRETTPNTDRLARESVLFESHFCQATSTKPSITSLLTGQYPDTHLTFGRRILPDSALTLERGLHHAGLHTVLFSSNPEASPWGGVCRDFDEALYQPQIEPRLKSSGDVFAPEPLLELLGEWLPKHGSSRFFAYLHFIPPHLPYSAPDEMKLLFIGQQPPDFRPGPFEFPQISAARNPKRAPALPEWINLYDANLRYADWAVGEVIRLLREAGLWDKTIFILSADHGEAFGDHGYVWHGTSVYPETTHIPLLIRFPRGLARGKRIPALTQAVDLMPTLFDLFQAPSPRESIQGRSLVPLLTGEADKVHDYIFARGFGDDPSYMMRGTDSALLLYHGEGMQALYDLRTDPHLTRNIASQDPARLEQLMRIFREHIEQQRLPPLYFVDPEAEVPTPPEVPEIEMDALQRGQLRALGYLK